jgi:hypothetical protein
MGKPTMAQSFDRWFETEMVEGRIPDTNGGADTWLRDHLRRAWEAARDPLETAIYRLCVIESSPSLNSGEKQLLLEWILEARSVVDSGWNPIATAPKDGTLVLAVCMRASIESSHMVGHMEVDAWHNQYHAFGKFNTAHWPATHWRPLPATPSVIEGGAA